MATMMRRCLRSELPLLVIAVYLPRIQILVVGGWVAIPSRVGRFGGPGAARLRRLRGGPSLNLPNRGVDICTGNIPNGTPLSKE
jgi:hypothetical protein